MKKLLLSLCVALLSCVAFAQTNVVVVLKDGTNVKYLAEDIDSIRIEKVTVVPAEETGLRFVYDDATLSAKVDTLENIDLTEVKIPSQVSRDGKVYDVTSIGDKAFYWCENITSVEIPNSVTYIGRYAFYYCSNLTSIKIPNSVNEIEYGAFNECYSLAEIKVNKGNNVFDSRDNCNAIIETASHTLITGCKNTIIPNSVTEIGWGAFANCINLESIEIPNSVTKIRKFAFFDCTSLKDIKIPNSVMEIELGTFYNCI